MVYRLYIKPYFENKYINVVNNNTLLIYFNYLLNKQLSKNSFMKTKFLVNQFSRFLVLNNYIDTYPIILNNIKYPNWFL